MRGAPFRRRSCLAIAIALVWVGGRSQDFAGIPAGNRRLPHTISCRALNWWSAFNTTDCLAQRTKVAFETHMKDACISLLETWESYEASLPVREGGDGVSKLYLQPYLCRAKELDVAVSGLEAVNKRRDRVAYLSAPTMRGKSAAILPMFCRSVELGSEESFTHYLYMPFANNVDKRNRPEL